MEILMMRKIPIINDYLWEQELGNMEFVRDNRLGIYERDIARLPGIVNDLISNDALYRLYRGNIDALTLRNGTREVSEFLVSLL
jgi:processive 1,2-diacylglycerol beta-glucosyltransferase/1,2-diacylglycerol 3-beta-galactosyltransferase